MPHATYHTWARSGSNNCIIACPSVSIKHAICAPNGRENQRRDRCDNRNLFSGNRILESDSSLSLNMSSLRLGYTAPNFEAETTAGPIKFHDWIGDSWVGKQIK